MDMNIIKRDIGLMCAAQKLLNFFCIMKTVLTVATIAFSVLESVKYAQKSENSGIKPKTRGR